MVNAFTHEYNEKDRLAAAAHERKKEMAELQKQIFNHKQKVMQDNMAFLWDLKFKFMREQDERWHKRMEKAFELKSGTDKIENESSDNSDKQ